MTKRSRKSAGLLPFRRKGSLLQVFLVHMGGPFWQHKEEGAWSLAKGELDDEAPLEAALREFEEETGMKLAGAFIELAPVKQPGGKTVFAWAVEWDCDPAKITSNSFSMEWPKGSGLLRSFPEVDRASWFSLEEARRMILKGQVPLIDQLQEVLGAC
jgi:predicted NUDIX family NTP pyrophosphohydrolase